MQKLKNEELKRLSIEQFKQAKKTPVVIILDNIRSMNNIGAAFRTSDAFRIEKIILAGITAKPPHRDIHKTALGATETVEWSYVNNIETAIKDLKSQHYQIIAVEQAKESVSLQKFIPSAHQHYALIFGNEVNGVSDQAMRNADECLEIPQIGVKHSLNISVSIGVVLWHFAEKLHVFDQS